MLTDIGRLGASSRTGTRPLPFFHDGILPNLWQLIDAPGIGQRFQAYFRLRYPAQRWHVVDCAVEKLYYRPEKGCKVLYRLQLRGRTGQLDEQWFFAHMYPAEISFVRFSRAQERAETAVSLWEPVGFWPELDTVFWAFPHDPQLKQLPKLIRPETMKTLFATHVPTMQPLGDLSYRRLKMMPRKRCLLQFTTAGLQFVTKSYGRSKRRQSKGAYAYQIFTDVYAATRENDRLTTPRPFFYDTTLDTYVQEACLGEMPMATADMATMQRVAVTLAQFHQLTDLPHLQPSQRTAGLVERVNTNAAFLAHFLPYDRRIQMLANRLTLVAVVLAGGSPLKVPIHGAFRLNQLLEHNGRYALLDLDDAGWGDPHFDVAECTASILIEHFTKGEILAELQANTETLLAAYQDNVSWPLEAARLHGYIALSLFQKLAGAFRRLETAVFPKIDQLLELIDSHLQQSM